MNRKLFASGAAACAAVVFAASGYHVARTFAIGGMGGWDYSIVDAKAGRLYVSHGSEVDVVDLASGQVTGKVSGTKGVHGIAIASSAGKGFISDGATNDVTIFDLKTLETKGRVKTGKKPDAIIYDDATDSVLAFNGDSDSATVLDAASGEAKGDIALGGGPEFAAADGHGKVYVNLEDKSEVLQIDPKTMKVDRRWPLKPCEEPSAMAMDRKTRRLFIGCHNQMM